MYKVNVISKGTIYVETGARYCLTKKAAYDFAKYLVETSAEFTLEKLVLIGLTVMFWEKIDTIELWEKR